MVDLILFPSSYFSVQKVDEDLQKEYEGAQNTGLFEVVFFGYDKWFQEGKLVLSMEISQMRSALYRGWMMQPEKYAQFYEALLQRNIRLVTTPEEYERMHIFPNVYKEFGEDTARMEIYPLHEQIPVGQVKKKFNRFLVKDYVKSVKGTEFPAYFDHSVTQEEFDKWMAVFYKYRGELLTGGICIKEFLDLKRYGERTNEYRVFYVKNQSITISPNSAQPDYVPQVPKELVEKYRGLNSVYYTVDFAEIADGSWRVIEAGDGSVSGLSEFQDAESYYRALYYGFAEESWDGSI